MRNPCHLLVALVCLAAAPLRAQEVLEAPSRSGNAFLQDCWVVDKPVNDLKSSELQRVNVCLFVRGGSTRCVMGLQGLRRHGPVVTDLQTRPAGGSIPVNGAGSFRTQSHVGLPRASQGAIGSTTPAPHDNGYGPGRKGSSLDRRATRASPRLPARPIRRTPASRQM